jgi:dihydroxyacid dehydratase/phosphogluconate dehydratase
VVGDDGIYRHRGPVRLFGSETAAVAAIKGKGDYPVQAGDVVVVAGIGPAGTGMEEIYQITSALKFIPWGKQVAVLTDGRFSGVSTGACIGHIGPEALAGGPIGKLRDGDTVEIMVDRQELTGSVELVATESEGELAPEQASAVLADRPTAPEIGPRADLPDDTRLWAALQAASGGTWAGCVYDTDAIVNALSSGLPNKQKSSSVDS